MKTTLATLALVALCIVGIFVWQSKAATPPAGEPTVKVVLENGHGSGVYIGNNLILTAAHVVDGAKDGKVKIKTEGGNILPGVVLWTSKERDIALIRVTGTFGLRAASLSCTTPKAGDMISARGSPGPIEFFTAWGHIAGTVRSFGPWLEVSPTDMTIVMGMSGGPAFNARGEVVGLAVGGMVVPMGSSASLTGVGFVVPGSTICPLLAR